MKERQEEGIRNARSKGRKFGRKKFEIDDKFESAYKDWKNHKITAVQSMKLAGMKNNTFYRRVKEYEKTRITNS